jgi:hypothetical protein
MRSWDDAVVTIRDLDYEQAVAAIRRREEEPLRYWNDGVWRLWSETGLDHRAEEELDEQPDEVQAYRVGAKTLRSLGLMPCDAGLHVVFVCDEGKWAVAASTATLIELDDDQLDDDYEEEDN